jgi:hypothetical protein
VLACLFPPARSFPRGQTLVKPSRRFDSVIDVAGGNRQLLATLLARCPHLNGVLFDRAEQVARGQQVGWR